MDSKEDIRPISYIRSGPSSDNESYEKMTRALGLLKLLTQGEQDIGEGRTQLQGEFFAEMDEYLKKGRS